MSRGPKSNRVFGTLLLRHDRCDVCMRLRACACWESARVYAPVILVLDVVFSVFSLFCFAWNMQDVCPCVRVHAHACACACTCVLHAHFCTVLCRCGCCVSLLLMFAVGGNGFTGNVCAVHACVCVGARACHWIYALHTALRLWLSLYPHRSLFGV